MKPLPVPRANQYPSVLLLDITLALAVIWSLLLMGGAPETFGADSSPDVRYVSAANGSDATPCTDPDAPCATIGYALSQANGGDAIVVAGGAYVQNLSIRKSVTLKGGYDPAGWSRDLKRHATTIEGNGKGRVITVKAPLSTTTLIDGFTITRGDGGILIDNSKVAIRNTRIVGNVATSGAGGGILSDASLMTITNSLIANNKAVLGGAIHILNTGSTEHSDALIQNCTIANNTADKAPGVLCSLTLCTVVNSIVWGHVRQDFAGEPSRYMVRYSNVEMKPEKKVYPGEGNISVQPRFLKPAVNPAIGDYHLRSYSPCMDRGANINALKTDYEGNVRPFDGDLDGSAVVDMGADEVVSHFSWDYSPYRKGQSPDPGDPKPSRADIEEDMAILETDAKIIRTYGACNELSPIAGIAKHRGIAVYQGVALSGDENRSSGELGCYRSLVGNHENIVAAVIGNETLLDHRLTEPKLIEYLHQARKMGNVPVSTGEPWGSGWCNEGEGKPRCLGRPKLANAVDFILAHSHPYWEGVPIEHAAAHVVAAHATVQAVYPGKRVVIGETGWPTCGSAHQNAVPGTANQRRFMAELWRWSILYRVPILFFEAFDEEWKAKTGNDVERCWGVHDSNRAPKHPSLDWSIPRPDPVPAAPSVRIGYPKNITTTVTKQNCGIPIFGKAYKAKAGWRVKVEVYTNSWYAQDKWYPDGRAPIVRGVWSMPEVFLAGQGQYNNHRIRVTLLDENGADVDSDEIAGIVRTNSCSP